jgi:hypothetical protein
MKKAYIFISICGIGLFLSALPLTVAPSLLQSLLGGVSILGLLFAVVATLIVGLVWWRKSSHWWIGPPLLCVAFVLGFIICEGILTRTGLDHWLFKRNMAPYVKIVDSIKNGTIPCGPTNTYIAYIDGKRNLPAGIRDIQAMHCSDGSTLVLFVAKGSSFAGHMGYLFKDAGTNSDIVDFMKREQIGLIPITNNWYQFWD